MENLLGISFRSVGPEQLEASVTVNQPYVSFLYKESLKKTQAESRVSGFLPGVAPTHYVESTYQSSILRYVHEFLLFHCVLPYLKSQLLLQKAVALGDLQLMNAHLAPTEPAVFVFSIAIITLKLTADWNKIPFKSPGRKNYRDLDKQVEVFLEEEIGLSKHLQQKTIQTGDWIAYSIQAIAHDETPLLDSYVHTAWIKIGDEETDEEIQELFLGKSAGDTFITTAAFLHNYIDETFEPRHLSRITIIHHVNHTVFCLDSFKKHFRLKTDREVHLKLIEIFSYRHDISQRRETIESAMKSLLKHHPFTINHQYIAKHKEVLLKTVHLNPDYYVYKAQSDFKDKINLLAEKQLKELIIVDAIAYKENITVSPEDILGYLNLMKRPRTREFIYFTLPIEKTYSREIPLPHETVYQQCLREKTLNHIIYHLTRHA